MDNVLKVFEGLTLNQAKELRRRIIETLPELRREVTGTAQASQNDCNGRKLAKGRTMAYKNKRSKTA